MPSGLLKSMIRTWKVDLVCLLKTEVQEMLLCVVRSLGVGRFLHGVQLMLESH